MCSAIFGRSIVCCITISEYEISGFFYVHTLRFYNKKFKKMKKTSKKSNEITFSDIETMCGNESAKVAKLQSRLALVPEWLSVFLNEQEKKSLALRVLNGTTDDKLKFFNDLAYGKWQFMMLADLASKTNPENVILAKVEDFNVDRVDATLPEIQQRLSCKVFKAWQRGKHFFLSKADEDFKDATIRRIGWLIDPKHDDKEDKNDSIQL